MHLGYGLVETNRAWNQSVLSKVSTNKMPNLGSGTLQWSSHTICIYSAEIPKFIKIQRCQPSNLATTSAAGKTPQTSSETLASLGISNHLSTEAAFSKWQAAAFIAGPKPSLVTGLGVPFCQVDQVPHVMCCSMGIQNSRCDGQVRILGKQRCRSWDLLLIKLFTTPSPEIYHKGL